MSHDLCFDKKYEAVKKIKLKIVIFTAMKNRCMLHGHGLVMKMFCKDLDTPGSFSTGIVLRGRRSQKLLLV